MLLLDRLLFVLRFSLQLLRLVGWSIRGSLLFDRTLWSCELLGSLELSSQ
jgi:hypothetical protein